MQILSRGSLNLAQLQRIALDLAMGKPPSIKGAEADRVRESFRMQFAEAKKKGLMIEMRSEIPDFDLPEGDF
jgi:hypothetical protein